MGWYTGETCPSLWSTGFRQALVLVVLAVLVGIGSNAVRSDGIAFIGDWSRGTASAHGDDETVVSLEEARELFEAGTALFVDARSDSEYRQGHISGAVSIPLEQAEQRFFDLLDPLYESQLIITYCDGESCNLSHDLAVYLRDMAVADVRVLVNGWTRWQQADLPMSSAND